MIIQPEDGTIAKVFRCGICKGAFYNRGPSYISCAVRHPPGTCCHYTDHEITDEQVVAILDILKEESDQQPKEIALTFYNPDGNNPVEFIIEGEEN